MRQRGRVQGFNSMTLLKVGIENFSFYINSMT